jgi:hypothetical protein
MSDAKAPTHTAFALKREGKKYGRWLEVGTARQDSTGVIHVFLDRTPVGGFNGYAYLAPIGAQLPVPQPQPQRPGEEGDAGDGGEEEFS